MPHTQHERDLITCAWLMGVGAACYELNLTPEGGDAAELQQHCHTCAQIVNEGGAFNPLAVYEARDYALSLQAALAARVPRHQEARRTVPARQD